MSVMNLVRVEEIRPDGKVRFSRLGHDESGWLVPYGTQTTFPDGYCPWVGITPNPIEETDIRVGKVYPCVSYWDTNVILAPLKPGFA